MNLAEKLTSQIQTLPQDLQREVLDFVEFLKLKKDTIADEEGWWGEFSLSSAIEGLDSEPDYKETDLKERW